MTLPPAATRQLRSIVREHGPISTAELAHRLVEPQETVLAEASAMDGIVYGRNGWEVADG